MAAGIFLLNKEARKPGDFLTVHGFLVSSKNRFSQSVTKLRDDSAKPQRINEITCASLLRKVWLSLVMSGDGH
jgi:hypothetical protein